MGQAKEQQFIQEEQNLEAAKFLVSIGELEECEVHSTIYGGGAFDLESDFWKKVVGLRKGSKKELAWSEGMSQIEYTDTIKAAYEENNADRCWQCEKILSE